MNNELSPFRLRWHRTAALRFAAAFATAKTDPVAVNANAMPLLEWLETGDAAEQRDRYEALDQAHSNRAPDREPDDAPESLIAEAKTYLAALHWGEGRA
jgi:hypothetical protein